MRLGVKEDSGEWVDVQAGEAHSTNNNAQQRTSFETVCCHETGSFEGSTGRAMSLIICVQRSRSASEDFFDFMGDPGGDKVRATSTCEPLPVSSFFISSSMVATILSKLVIEDREILDESAGSTSGLIWKGLASRLSDPRDPVFEDGSCRVMPALGLGDACGDVSSSAVSFRRREINGFFANSIPVIPLPVSGSGLMPGDIAPSFRASSFFSSFFFSSFFGISVSFFPFFFFPPMGQRRDPFSARGRGGGTQSRG